MINNFITSSIFTILILMTNMNASEIIKIGTIDGEAQNKLPQFEAIAKYIEKKLNNKNMRVIAQIPKDIKTAIKLINNNKLNILMDSVYPTLVIQKQTNIDIEAKRWKKGQEGYQSIIFTRKESLINKLEDLKGKTIAFEDDFSTSSYYIPKKALEKKGLVLSKNKTSKNHTKYLFSKSEMNSAAWVLFKKVDAAATDNITYDAFDKDLYKVIYQSKMIARQLVSFSKDVNEKLKKEILNILLNMHKNKEGQKVLKQFANTKQFSKLKKNEEKMWRLTK